jgi:hypothetical protein
LRDIQVKGQAGTAPVSRTRRLTRSIADYRLCRSLHAVINELPRRRQYDAWSPRVPTHFPRSTGPLGWSMCEAPGRGTFDTNVGRKSTYVPPTSWETRELQLERFWNLASFNSSVLEPRSRSDLHFTGGMQGDLQAGVTLGDLVGSGLLLIGDSGDWGSTIFVVAIAWGTNAQPCVARDQAGKQETCTKHSGIFMVMIGLPATSLTATALARASEVVHDEETKKPTCSTLPRRGVLTALHWFLATCSLLSRASEGGRRTLHGHCTAPRTRMMHACRSPRIWRDRG